MCSDRVRRVVGKFNKNITLPSCLGLKSAAVTTYAAGQASPRSQLRKEMWLIGDKYDWLAKKSTWELGQLNDWRRLSVSITGGGDFASALLFVTVSPMQCMTSSSVVLQLSQHWRLRLISHINTRYDWLWLDKIRLAAATWWRRLRRLVQARITLAWIPVSAYADT